MDFEKASWNANRNGFVQSGEPCTSKNKCSQFLILKINRYLAEISFCSKKWICAKIGFSCETGFCSKNEFLAEIRV